MNKNFLLLKNPSPLFKLAFIAIMSSVSIVVGFLEIPYPLAPWLKFDLSEVILLLTINFIGADLSIIMVIIRSVVRYFLTGGTNVPFPFYGEGVAIIVSYLLIFSYSFIKEKLLINKVHNAEAVGAILLVLFFPLLVSALNYFFIVPAYTSAGQFYFVSQAYLNNYFNAQVARYLITIISLYYSFNLIKFSFVLLIFNLTFPQIKTFISDKHSLN